MASKSKKRAVRKTGKNTLFGKPRTKKISTPLIIGVLAVIVLAAAVQIYLQADKNSFMPPKFVPTVMKAWGGTGSKPGPYFNSPRDLACDSKGNVYVADTGNNRIQKFDGDGNFIKAWGSKGILDGQFNGPCGITADSQDNLWVVDFYSKKLQQFNPEGALLRSVEGEHGSTFSIAADANDHLWVTNASGRRIHEYDAHGAVIKHFGTQGRKKGTFVDPTGVLVDESGNIYVVDSGNRRIQKFNASVKFVKQWTPPKDSPARLLRAVWSPGGNVCVLDEISKVWVLTKDLKPLKVIVDPAEEKLGALSGIAFDRKGNLFLSKLSENRIVKLAPVEEPPLAPEEPVK